MNVVHIYNLKRYNNPESGCVLPPFYDYATTFRVECCFNKRSQGSLWQPWAQLRNANGIVLARNYSVKEAADWYYSKQGISGNGTSLPPWRLLSSAASMKA